MTLLSLAGPVVDFGAVPWTAIMIGVGLGWALLEARLVKAGFVRQKSLDDVATKVGTCVRTQDMDGLARRFEERMTAGDREREALETLYITNRTDLDATRDRTTRLEGEHQALATRIMDRLAALPEIDRKLDKALLGLERHETEIANLKRDRA